MLLQIYFVSHNSLREIIYVDCVIIRFCILITEINQVIDDLFCRSMVSRKCLANAYPGKKGGTGVAQVDSSTDGNAGVVPPRQPPLNSFPLPQPPTPLAGQGRLEEKNDRISKEKQKFFRLSAFNAEHSKLKRVGGGDKSRPSRNISARSTRGATANPKKVGTSRVSSSSSSSSSSSRRRRKKRKRSGTGNKRRKRTRKEVSVAHLVCFLMDIIDKYFMIQKMCC